MVLRGILMFCDREETFSPQIVSYNPKPHRKGYSIYFYYSLHLKWMRHVFPRLVCAKTQTRYAILRDPHCGQIRRLPKEMGFGCRRLCNISWIWEVQFHPNLIFVLPVFIWKFSESINRSLNFSMSILGYKKKKCKPALSEGGDQSSHHSPMWICVWH